MSSEHGFAVTRSLRILDADFLAVDERQIRTPDGSVINRIVISHPGAVAVVPLIDDDIILIEQYRAAADALILEIPAGKLEQTDDDRIRAAGRELREETGYVAGSIEHLTEIWPAVGYSNEVITILIATELEKHEPAPDGAEERAATVHRIPFAEAVKRVVSGDITDAKTVAGILIAHAHRTTS